MNKEKLKKAGYCCVGCGLKYGESNGSMATFHEGKCEMCDEIKAITSVRRYNYLRKV